MTVPNDRIIFNADTGSDTQSSGLGPTQAVYGNTASTSAASATVTGIDTTGVTAGDLLWVQTSSGRQFSIIASVDSATQVTCDETFSNNESGLTWAIGGKRATFDNTSSRNLLDYLDNYYCIVETETDQSLTSTISRNNGSFFTLKGNDKTISCNGNFSAFSHGQHKNIYYYNLKFSCVTGNTVAAVNCANSAFHYCVFGERGSANNFKTGVNVSAWGSSAVFFRCKFYGQGNTTGDAIVNGWYASSISIITECSIFDFQYAYKATAGGGSSKTMIKNSIISNCQYGVFSDQNMVYVHETIFHDILNDAIYFTNTASSPKVSLDVLDRVTCPYDSNIFINVGGYLANFNVSGLSISNTTSSPVTWYQYNCLNGTIGFDANVINLTADPFRNPSAGDFNINNTTGGGAILRSASYTF